jgi:hypothetical protein
MLDPIKGDPSYKSFGSISNHDQPAEIARWVNYFPAIPISKFIVTEKLDGSCFSAYITANDIIYNSRRKILEDTDGFNDHQRVMHKYAGNLELIQEYITANGITSVRLFGELFGKVFSRVNNGNENDFRVFAVEVDDVQLCPEEGIQLLDTLSINTSWWVPILGIFDTFKEAYDFDIDIDTVAINGDQVGEGSKKIEGVVITAYDQVFKYIHDEGDKIFKLKKKSETFKDKGNKKEYVAFEGSDEYTRLHGIWSDMINENRLLDLFSKEGKIESITQISKYIPLMLKDVKDDFFAEHKAEFIMLDDAEKKKIIGSTAGFLLPLLKAHL